MFASKDTLLTRPSGYTIARSVRLRSSATAYFNRTLTTPTNNKIWTWSSWVKRGTLGSAQVLLSSDVGTSNTTWLEFGFDAADTFTITAYTTDLNTTSAVFRDPSAWYHIVVAFDSTQATAANRCKIYVNGIQQTLTGAGFTLNAGYGINSAQVHGIGYRNWSSGVGRYFDGYMTEINFIDGQQLTPSSFGETDTTTGVWKPKKYAGTYGTNGFYLNFSDNSNNTAATIGKDYSGNGNNWTPNNISVTSGVTYDSMTDVPTLTSATAANYAVMNPVAMTSNISATNGNLTTSFTGLANAAIYSTFMLPTSGKWYFESIITTVNTATSQDAGFGIVDATTTLSNISAQTFSNGVIYRNRGDSDSRLVVNGSSVVSGNTYSWSNSDVVQIAYDADSGKVWVGRNNSWFDTSGGTTGNPSSGTNQIGTLTTTINMLPVARAYSNTLVMNWNFGQRAFAYTAPSGYVALNTYNLPASTITNGAAYMAATLYSANNGTQTITNTVNGVSFQPDFIWTKSRSNAYGALIYDSIRNVGNFLQPASTAAESNNSTTLISINSNGYTVGANDNSNYISGNSVGWQWKAGGTSSSNTNGSITSTVSVGATQGFSVVTYTGTGANATVGHGLGVAPSMVIVKRRDTTANWEVRHTSIAVASSIQLNLTNASASATTVWNSTAPSSTVFSIGTSATVNASSGTYVAYCFSAVAGYSAFGSYTGNGSTNGPFIYTGFRPRFVMLKNSSATSNWTIFDTTRNPYNFVNLELEANLSNAESDTTASYSLDILSNGFKIRAVGGTNNTSGQSVIYACWAENPFRNALAR